MKDYFRMNVLLKVSTVIILGYFVFELLFGIVTGNFGMYGSTGSAGSHHPSGSGQITPYSYDVIINALLLLLVKLLIVILFLVLISGAFRLMKDIWSSEDYKNTKKVMKYKYKDKEILLTVTGALIGIMVLYSVCKGFYLGATGQRSTVWNNIYLYGNHVTNIDNFYSIFFNVLLYITAIILGVEVFNYFIKKEKGR